MKKLIFWVGLILVVGCVAAGSIYAYVVAQSVIDKSSEAKKEVSVSKLATTPKPPKTPQSKTACNAVDSKFIAQLIGEGAVKNAKLPAFGTEDYSATNCEYAINSVKASIILYQYPSEKDAGVGTASVQRETLVLSADGKSTRVQPRQSAVGQKGKYLVSAAVVAGAAYDEKKSQSLLKQALEKL